MASYGRRSLLSRLVEVVKVFTLLGWTAFGGTTANIVLLRNTFVMKLEWVDDRTFNDLLALGNALPGPAFSQLAFSISALRGGVIPALLSFVLLTYPGSVLMITLGFAVRRIPNELPPIVLALFTGLNSAAVGLVCVAAYQLSKKVVTDNVTRIILFLTASAACCYESQWLFPVLMVLAGSASLLFDLAVAYHAKQAARKAPNICPELPEPQPTLPELELNLPPKPSSATKRNDGIDITTNALVRITSNSSSQSTRNLSPPRGMAFNAADSQQGEVEEERDAEEESYFTLSIQSGLMIASTFFAVLITMLVVRATTPHKRALDFSTNMVLAGTLIFGGGPVVVPLLRGYTVDPGWVSGQQFLLGYAILQALPGPQFNFAGYLGVLILPSQPVLGGILGILSIFLPGILLKLGCLPLYTRWKEAKRIRSVLRGLSAGAVGLIFAAVYQLFQVGYIQRDPTGSFVAVDAFNLQPPFAIIGGALAGLAWFGVQVLHTPLAGLQSISAGLVFMQGM